ncbi:MAG: prolipoprotein diacylglyceryl transferase [Pseudomonadales bacterium]|nr:prolipoprotein diacylglyceryl transferase [Candidatus Woesebacteria bacterium]MCB9802021.1 prolipoprotein diacylglyceryl transferase [Pseudomonadales bacterium]
MLPVLVSFGSFSIHTLPFFLVISFFLMLFLFWRKGRAEHLSEYAVFDVLLLALLGGLLLGRLVFIVVQYPSFQLDVGKWLNVLGSPGMHSVGFIAGMSYVLYRQALKRKWDAFEVLDFLSIALSFTLSFLYVGLFFDGAGHGRATTLPIGIRLPESVDAYHPRQLYVSLGFLLIGIFLTRVEYRYRTFSWYRSSKNTAKTGFLFSCFLLFAGSLLFLASLTQNQLGTLPYGNYVLYLLLAASGAVLLWRRSGSSERLFSSKSSQSTHVRLLDSEFQTSPPSPTSEETA